MDQSYLPDIKKLVSAGQITYKLHGCLREMECGITTQDIFNVLTSTKNQVIEIQKPTSKSPDERVLVFDPTYEKDIIVVLALMITIAPEVRVITVELVDYDLWDIHTNGEVSLVRKTQMI